MDDVVDHPVADSRKRLVARVRRALGKSREGAVAKALAEDLFSRVAAEDLGRYAPAEIATFVRCAAGALADHRPGRPLVRLTAHEDVGPANHRRGITLVECVNDDMPFLVDSIIGEVQQAGAEIRLVAHPIVSVVRDRSGRLVEYVGLGAATARGARRESLVHLHLDRLSGDDSKALAHRLGEVLQEVKRAVDGWQPMRARVRQVIDEYRSTPPPVPEGVADEAVAFLEWLLADNFTFLGIREYDFVGGGKAGELRRRATPGLGILSDPGVRVLRRGAEPVTTTPAIREFLLRPDALIVTKTNVRSRVHRRVYMDYVGAKLFAADGSLRGELRIIGLFTSTAYTGHARDIPFLRHKVARVLLRSGLDPHSHSGKALTNVLESYPRDELFQIDEDRLFQFAQEIVALEERPRTRAFVRPDRFDRYVSVIVYVPRDRYDSVVREKIGAYVAAAFDGHVSAYYPAFPDGPLARVHFIIGRDRGPTPTPARGELEAGLAAIVRNWADALRAILARDNSAEREAMLVRRYADAFPAGYRSDFAPDDAAADIDAFEGLAAGSELQIRLRAAGRPECLRLKLIHLATPIALSERVPILENMGFRVIDEQSYRIAPADRSPIHVHDMALETADGRLADLAGRGPALADCLSGVWHGEAENDGFNALVLTAGLAWREAALLRAVARYLRQAGTPYSQHYMWSALVRHPAMAALLVRLFRARFDPDGHTPAAAAAAGAEIESGLEAIASLDEDRVIRRLVNVIDAMVRTNFFQRTTEGRPRADISFKLDCARVDGLPDPRPYREIFVHSTRVEGIHLRFGKVARGGIRWSDRPYDFRTEILGLVKAQQVKNAVIVPVGAKGGFVPQRLPAGGSRDATLAEGTAAYRLFISSLLDITDNLRGAKVVPPQRVVRRDEDDPYLVVAADKGTAAFSDIANGIADEHGFWLSDAFASGGSAGYDHKAMGITARGAWEAVKRHFRGLDIDIQATPFTVAGVGDMSGDVFGNAMLLSPKIRLLAAFDHRDIFIDPEPDIEASFAERQRLFALPRSSWQDYDRARLSPGGGVFSRSDKAIRLGREVRDLLGIESERATPQDVMRAILRARVDLLWFGGIGTFVKAADESDERVGDRANDAIRISGAEVRARVVGEGANLGMTQRGRVEYSLAGGLCNSDAIDNSAGVNTSDVEVNIKIGLAGAMRDGRLDRARRNRMLAAMTADVARLVLRNNYLQSLAISVAVARGMEDFRHQWRLMQELEARGRLNRAVEFLPDDVAMAERQRAARPLTRPEIAVLLAYAKIALYDDLLTGDLSDPAFDRELTAYFPPRMAKSFDVDIGRHPLRREIIATVLANAMINLGGPAYLVRASERAKAAPDALARSHVAVRNVFAIDAISGAIDALDNRVPGAAQLALYRTVQDVVLDAIAWFAQRCSFAGGIAAVVTTYAAAVGELGRALDLLLPPMLAEEIGRQAEALAAAGAPETLARQIARLQVLARAPEIHLCAQKGGCGVREAAAAYLALGEHLHIRRLADAARAIVVADRYERLVLDRALDMLEAAHGRIAIAALTAGGERRPDTWLAARSESDRAALAALDDIAAGPELTVSRLSVAASLLADLAASAGG